MKFCYHCGTHIPDHFTFCPNCGQKQPTIPAPVQPQVPAQPIIYQAPPQAVCQPAPQQPMAQPVPQPAKTLHYQTPVQPAPVYIPRQEPQPASPPVYPVQAPTPAYAAPAVSKAGLVLGKVGLALGIASLASGLLFNLIFLLLAIVKPDLSSFDSLSYEPFTLTLGIVAVILSGIARKRGNYEKQSLLGLIFGIVGIALGVLSIILFVVFVSSAGGSSSGFVV